MTRLFAGIELDARARATCVGAQSRLREAAYEARYEPPEKLHVTIAFLGNVETVRVPGIEAALDDVATHTPPFTLSLDKLGAFPHARRPRIVFIGSRAQGAPFRTLAATLRLRFEAMGFTFADDAVMHVTIARTKGRSTRPLPLLDIAATELAVGAIALFESLPDKQTTRYVVRRSAPLGVDRKR